MSEEKKNVKIEEINEEELDLVAGGVIPEEVWNKMTTAERLAALQRSKVARASGQECELD